MNEILNRYNDAINAWAKTSHKLLPLHRSALMGYLAGLSFALDKLELDHPQATTVLGFDPEISI